MPAPAAAAAAPAVLRFAGPAIGKALRALFPTLGQGSLRSAATWRPAAGDIAMDVLPNLAFSAFSGMALPGADPAIGFEGASMAERIGAGAADFAMSYPAGIAGRLGGAALTAGYGRLRGRPLGMQSRQMVQNIGGLGGEMALWGSGILQNPVTAGAFDRYNQAMTTAEEADRRAFRDQVLAQERERRAREQELAMMGGPAPLLAGLDGFGGFG
jgi:hypothetical protein